MRGNGNEVQFLKLKQTLDDSLWFVVICSFPAHKDTHRLSQVVMDGLNGLMNVCLNVRMFG
jgi:hypothetical protein